MAEANQIQDLKISDIPPGTCRIAYANGKEIAIFNVDGKLYATQSDCTHRGGPLCEGELAGEIVTCPWHGSQFNVRTGEVVMDPAEEPIATYPITVRDDQVIIEI
jgi:nitrite reductase/ring-hydroxylating ferredoxin subunit